MSEELKQVLMVCDPHGQVSGYTVFSDGTKAYWTEGRSSEVRLVMPDGAIKDLDSSYVGDPYLELLAGDPPEAQREMTPAEQIEYMLEIEGRFR